MLSAARFHKATVSILGLALAACLVGCPFGSGPPNYPPAILVSTRQLDFGTAQTTLTFLVAKTWTSQTLPPFTVAADRAWVTVNPTTGTSDGPDDPVEITVTINRQLMPAGQTATITVSAAGIVPQTVTVIAQGGLAANFTANKQTVVPGENVTFTDTSFVATDVGPIDTWLWTFGDGATSPLQNPTHPYAAIGSYEVSLTVWAGTRSDTKTVPNYITVQHTPPTAEFTVSRQDPVPGEEIQFTDLSATGSLPPITDWLWNFGDGITSVSRDPAHIYWGAAQYSVSLTVWTTAGSDTETKLNYIQVAPPPTPDFTANTTFGDATLQVQFTGTAVRGKTVSGWEWDFGDGSGPGYGASPVHDYTSSGVFDVTLTVTTEWGNYSTSKENYIHIADPCCAVGGSLDLAGAAVLTRPEAMSPSEAMAPTMLIEEIEKRTGVALAQTTEWPSSDTVIAIMSRDGQPTKDAGKIGASREDEGFRMFVEEMSPPKVAGQKVLWIIGADGPGAMYGVGKLLRSLSWTPTGQVMLDAVPNLDTAPQTALRGHQIGYRNLANSYDAWDEATYEQYIRELVVFGANAVENIPIDSSVSPHFPISQTAMNYAMSDACYRYGIEYWIWTPAQLDVSSPANQTTLLNQYEAVYQNCRRLDDVFIPGGDPGSNDPADLMPFLADVAALLHSYWPNAGLWVSNQGFEHAENDTFFNYLQTQQPAWLEGVVFGPWAKITINEMRTRTPGQYKLRRYPDITHSVRCQYPVEHRDRAFAHTLGRENPNPRPADESQIFLVHAAQADGFLAYSDGCHDDLNKQIWSMRGWSSGTSVDDMLLDYTRFFFGVDAAPFAATGLAGLEDDEVGPLASNAGVDATFALWQFIENTKSGKALADTNWRWQLYLLRAYYDMYIKERLIYENTLQANAYVMLGNAGTVGADTAMAQATAELAKATTQPVRQDLKTRIEDLCVALFNSIGFQTSVNTPYLASGSERGAILDFVDHPLNDRTWLESEFTRIGALGSEGAKLTEIEKILDWEDPGTGGFYDDLGNVSKEPHVVYQKTYAQDPGFVESTQDEFSKEKTDWRLSWQDQAQTLFGQPLQMQYTGLNPASSYRLRVMYAGRFNATMTLTADGTQIHGAYQGPQPPSMSTVQSYDIPQALTSDGTLNLEWALNGGRGCQVAEVWLEVR